jgi:hypothetical protein
MLGQISSRNPCRQQSRLGIVTSPTRRILKQFTSREFSWSFLEWFWRAELPSRTTLNLSLHYQPYQHGANCRSRQLAAFDKLVDWGWNRINILKLRLRCAEVAFDRLFHQIAALQLRILG